MSDRHAHVDAGPLVPFTEVRAEILRSVRPLETIEVDRLDALGLVLAADVVSGEAVPPFPNTGMDGYAVRAADTVGADLDVPRSLRVIGELAAGAAPTLAVGPGEAIRIMTGAPMPPGADAVVMVERTRRVGPDHVAIEVEVEPGRFVRDAGGDVRVGDVVFEAGTRLGAGHVGVLAAIGADRVAVVRRPRVAILSTGDELRERGALVPGAIRDANRPMLVALALAAGVEPRDYGIVPDDEERLTEVLTAALDDCDAVITSGGVSVGDYDYVKAVLDRLGEVHWRQVAIKPAKPLAHGIARGTPVFGLPGNPASSFVSFELFARPALLAMAGDPRCLRAEVVARAGSDFVRPRDGKVHVDRVDVVVEGGALVARRTGEQASNVLSASARANGLALVPDGDGVRSGEALRVVLLEAPMRSGPAL